MTFDTDVVVVGAGPVGLLLAGDLRAHGIGVVVLEKLTAPTGESRASILHARTMEQFAARGVLDLLGPVQPAGLGHFGGIRFDLADADPAHPYAGQWECLQFRVEAALEKRASAAGAVLHRGWALTSFESCHDRVVVIATEPGGAERRFTARYLVGCDGEHSTVRELGGFVLAGPEASREMLRADIAGIDLPPRRLKRYPAGVATAHSRGDGTTRLMVHVFGGRTTGVPTFAEVADAWETVTGEDIRHGKTLWLNRFTDAARQVTQYRRGRVFLAGDAAHQQMPVGGQALNLGLADGASLGENLAAGTLDHYHAQRHAAGARTLTNIRAQAHLTFGGPEVAGLRHTIAELIDLPAARTHLARVISGLHTERTVMGRLTGKTALVTGSSRGIGCATAVRLAREGALVIVHYATNEAAAKETVAQVESDGGRAFAVRASLGVPGDLHELFLGIEHGLKERTGETTLDIVVNNAGVTSPDARPEDTTPEQLDQLFAVNAKAPFLIVQRALDLLPDGGRIVNISSGLTRFANPGQAAYAMTKGAIEQLTLHFARHLAPRGITVNTVAPGITNNGGPVFDIPEAVEQMAQVSAFKRVGEAGDVADVITFLATDEARWVTGAFIDATGGTLL
jgi:NAD(P)-dependent dehydrogenase (short-subunit alcohol dehydrogenase family)/2-polyprenyl-6-methoxyphenol hydroxylase-like FAD-dependent oxidoreductase